MSLEHQTKLFLAIDPHLQKLCGERLPNVDFDNRMLINSIAFTEVCNLIIKQPKTSEDTMKICAGALINFLRNGEVLKMLRTLEDRKSIPFVVSTSNNVSSITFNLKSLDYYLLECYKETVLMRDARIEAFLNNFIVYHSLEFEIFDGSYRQAEDLFYAILRKTTERFYYLTDMDLDILIVWLVNSYNNQTDIFSSVQFDKGKKFTVPLITRDVYIHWIDISGMISKKK
jgi:hypothetical protein